MNLLKKLYQKEIKPDFDYFFITGAVLIFTLLRIPSLIEPDWYGDEGIYQVIGVALNQGRLLYQGIWDNKPPILYLYYALVNGDLFFIKLLSLIFGAGAIVVFYFVAAKIFNNRVSSYISTLCFAVLFGLPLLEGNIANAENFMLLPILAALYLILHLKKKSSVLLTIGAGLLLSLAFLTKIVAIFDLVAFITILLGLRFYNQDAGELGRKIRTNPREFLVSIKQELVLLTAFIIPIILVFIIFIVNGAVGDFMRAAFSQNVGYVGYGNYFIIPQGLLLVKLVLLIIGVFVICVFRKKMGAQAFIIYMWLLFSLCNAFFSGRPYTHYVLVVLPAFCLYIGLIFMARRLLLINLIILIIVLPLLRTNFTYYTHLSQYYNNYFSYVAGEKSVEEYQSFFDSSTPQMYELAQFIKMNTKKTEYVFILGDAGQIYFLADRLPVGRYTVAYHVSFYKNAIDETKDAIALRKPKYIIDVKHDTALTSNFVDGYAPLYSINGATIYERQF